MILNILSVVLVALLGTASAVGNSTADKVTDLSSLPGWPKETNFSMFSGYIDIKNTTKRIHYVFLESMHEPDTSPMVVWFNGGPGCSSMLGFLQETGPYVLMDGDTNYTKNNYTWNNETNILYIEQPAGVGYSTCDNLTAPQDCVHDDESSAQDNLQVLLGFFEKFSDKPYKKNPIYISGESYAGIYVPLLSFYVHDYNQKNVTNATEQINLKGFFVGNGVTNWTYDTTNATFDVAFYRMLIPHSLKHEIDAKKCNFSGIGLGDATYLSEECAPLLDQMYDAFNGIDIYNIYGKCWDWQANFTNFTSTNPRDMLYGTYKSKSGKVHEYQKFWSAREYTPWAMPLRGSKAEYGIPGCIYALPAAEHLNNETVRAALNIETEQPWRMCSTENSTFSYTKSASASQWAYELLRDTPIRMMHFSGDMDASVPTIGTQRWVHELKWNETSPWQTHLTPDENVGGYYQQFEGDFTLITVHGAGHMVPQDQRAIAYNTLFNWLFERGEFKKEDPSEEQKPEFFQQ